MIVLGVVAATVAGFLLGGVYYSVAPSVPAYAGHTAPARPGPSVALVELLRSAAVAVLVAGLMAAGSFSGPLQGALLGLALGIVPIVLLAGSVFHEGTSPRSGLLHAGDWVLKLVAIGLVVGIFV